MKVQMMSAPIKTRNQEQQFENYSVETRHASSSATPTNPAIQRSLSLIKKGNYTEAAKLLAAAGRDPQVRNALGVCLMRAGRVENAVNLYREFVLVPGTLLERADVSNTCKRNFATALLLKGFPSGALSVLKGTHEPDHPMAVRITAAIKQWEKSLPWFRRLDWRFNAIEPRNCHVPIDFEPGEFDFDVEFQQPPPNLKIREKKALSSLPKRDEIHG